MLLGAGCWLLVAGSIVKGVYSGFAFCRQAFGPGSLVLVGHISLDRTS